MSEPKLKPCPLCGGEAKRDHRYVWCGVPGCGMAMSGLGYVAWQALPRPSEAAVRIAGEMRECRQVHKWLETDCYVVAQKIDTWTAQLESLASHQPGTLAKDDVLICKCGMRLIRPHERNRYYCSACDQCFGDNAKWIAEMSPDAPDLEAEVRYPDADAASSDTTARCFLRGGDRCGKHAFRAHQKYMRTL